MALPKTVYVTVLLLLFTVAETNADNQQFPQEVIFKTDEDSQKFDFLVEEIKALKKRLTEIEATNSLSQQFNQNAAAIGFTAGASAGRSYQPGDTVLFDVEITNSGGYYNSVSSVFECPVNGHYIFFVNFYTRNDQAGITAGIYLDDLYLVGLYGPGEISETSATFVYTYCEVGQVVSVRCTGGSGPLVGDQQRESSFSGLLITQSFE